MAKNAEFKLAIKIAGAIDPSLGKAINSASGIAGAGFKTMAAAAAAATTAAAAFGIKAVKSAAAYETQLANVATLLDGTKDQVAARTAEIGKDILKVSNDTGIATAGLTDGMYNVISAFGDSKDAVSQLEIASKAAVAGNSTTTDSINLLSAVTKAYGDTSAAGLQKVSDLAFETVKLGQTTFPELASSMQQVTGSSKTLGVSQDELFGVFATATGVTGETAAVATQLKAVYSNLLKPTTAMSAAFKKMGYSSSQSAIEQLGLQGTLDALAQSVGGDSTKMANMFSSTEALNLVLGLTGNLSDALTTKTAAMAKATGATNAAFDTQTDTLDYTIQSIKNLGSNFMTQVGQEMLPVVKDFAQQALPAIQEKLPVMAEKLSEIFTLVGTGVNFISQHSTLFTALAIGVGVMSIAMKGAAIAQAAMTAAQAADLPVAGALSVATTGLSLPFLAIAAAIAAVVAVGYVLYKNWDTVKAKAGELWAALSGFATGVKEDFAAAFSSLVAIVKIPFNAIIKMVNKAITGINKIHVTLPNWGVLGEWAGAEIGFNMKTIPALAQGGIVSSPTLAQIGEGGEPEAVTPLSKLEGMLTAVVERLFGGGGENETTTPTGDGQFVFAPVQHFYGTTSREDVEAANAASFAQFKVWMAQWEREHKRVAFKR